MLSWARPWSRASFASRAKNGAASIPSGGTAISPATGSPAARGAVEQRRQVAERDAAFLRLVADVDLDEAVGALARRRDCRRERIDQRRPVDRMDDVEQRHRVARLVRLQLADEVEADARPCRDQRRPFRRRLLHPVLAEAALPGREQRFDRLGGVGFGNRDQLDRVAAAPRAPGGGGNAGADRGKARGGVDWRGVVQPARK